MESTTCTGEARRGRAGVREHAGGIPGHPKTNMRDSQNSFLAEALVEMDRRVGSSNPSIEAQLVRNRLHK